jgi:hypothetical protein
MDLVGGNTMGKLKVLLIVNGIFNTFGAVILVFAPIVANPLLGIEGNSDFIWHLLAVCSLSLGVLSFLSIKFNERFALKSSVIVFCVFHGVSALVSVLEIFNGLPGFVFGNTAIHLLFFILFIIFFRATSKDNDR